MLNYKLSLIFPKPTIYAGYIILAIGIIFSLMLLWGGLILILLGYFVSQSYNGIQINAESKQYRSYSHIFGMKFGAWKSLNSYCYLSVLPRKDSYRAYSYAMSSMTDSDNYFGIFLLSQNHRKKLEIRRHGQKDAAFVEAQEIAEILNLKLVKYQPQVSKSTQIRRRARQ